MFCFSGLRAAEPILHSDVGAKLVLIAHRRLIAQRDLGPPARRPYENSCLHAASSLLRSHPSPSLHMKSSHLRTQRRLRRIEQPINSFPTLPGPRMPHTIRQLRNMSINNQLHVLHRPRIPSGELSRRINRPLDIAQRHEAVRPLSFHRDPLPSVRRARELDALAGMLGPHVPRISAGNTQKLQRDARAAGLREERLLPNRAGFDGSGEGAGVEVDDGVFKTVKGAGVLGRDFKFGQGRVHGEDGTGARVHLGFFPDADVWLPGVNETEVPFPDGPFGRGRRGGGDEHLELVVQGSLVGGDDFVESLADAASADQVFSGNVSEDGVEEFGGVEGFASGIGEGRR